MSNFLAIHTLPKPVTIDEAASLGRQIYSHTTADVRWVKSWVQLNEEGNVARIFCMWEAPSAESVREVFTKVPGFPIDGIYPMLAVDPESL